MAQAAILRYRWVLKQERPALFAVALQAGGDSGSANQAGMGGAAMGVVAIRTAGFSFFNGVARRQLQLCFHGGMAVDTNINLVAGVQYQVPAGMGLVTLVATNIFLLVCAALPHNATIILVALQALVVTLGNR